MLQNIVEPTFQENLKYDICYYSGFSRRGMYVSLSRATETRKEVQKNSI